MTINEGCWQARELSVGPDWIEGHFPGNSMVPGVVLQDCLWQTMRCTPSEKFEANFKRVVRPDDILLPRIHYPDGFLRWRAAWDLIERNAGNEIECSTIAEFSNNPRVEFEGFIRNMRTLKPSVKERMTQDQIANSLPMKGSWRFLDEVTKNDDQWCGVLRSCEEYTGFNSWPMAVLLEAANQLITLRLMEGKQISAFPVLKKIVGEIHPDIAGTRICVCDGRPWITLDSIRQRLGGYQVKASIFGAISPLKTICLYRIMVTVGTVK